LAGLGWTVPHGVELQPKIATLAVTVAAVFRCQRFAMGYGGEVPASGGGESTEV
jgi:hypothetical protein